AMAAAFTATANSALISAMVGHVGRNQVTTLNATTATSFVPAQSRCTTEPTGTYRRTWTSPSVALPRRLLADPVLMAPSARCSWLPPLPLRTASPSGAPLRPHGAHGSLRSRSGRLRPAELRSVRTVLTRPPPR